MIKPVSHKMLFPSPRKLKEGNVSKIKPIECRVFINDDFNPNKIENFIVDVRSEVHSSIQDLSATLFRRGVRVEFDKLVIVYGPRSIAKIEMVKLPEDEKEEKVDFYKPPKKDEGEED